MSFYICSADCCYEKEQLKTAFDFKGNALTCLWQIAVRLSTEQNTAVGLGVQSVLWSDSAVYRSLGEEEGNLAMLRLTRHALKLLEHIEVETPFDALDKIFSELYTYAQKLTGSVALRKTFVLNALVPVDFALWQLWCKENGKASFDDICRFDGQYCEKLLNIPLITYNTSIDSVRELAENGASLLKIKIGSDPDGRNDPEAMLEWDKKRISDIHNTVKHISTPYTDKGTVLYYLDANGRYDKKERLLSLLDHADKEGFLDRIILLEEPFDELNKIDVHGIPVTVVADESAHSCEDVLERLELGYRALALKPIAKSLSLTIRMAELARKNSMLCFCADLTVNPVMVSWNQCVASRLSALPGMRIGVIESNGEQNYSQWDKMMSYHPLSGSSFTTCKNGVFHLDNSFYKTDGGIFDVPTHYADLIRNGGGTCE